MSHASKWFIHVDDFVQTRAFAKDWEKAVSEQMGWKKMNISKSVKKLNAGAVTCAL